MLLLVPFCVIVGSYEIVLLASLSDCGISSSY